MPSNQDPANSGRFRKSPSGIDAPDLPSWSRLVDEIRTPLVPAPMSEDDETPTLRHDDLPPAPVEPEPPQGGPRAPTGAGDPKDLARRLAEEAKKRLARSGATPAPPPPRAESVPVPAEPEKKTKEEVSPMSEDPRELARRLAEEAKRRLHETPAPVPHHNEPPPPAPAPPPPEPRPIQERFAPARGGKMSAAEALAAAREAERRQREAQNQTPAAREPEPEVRPAAPRTMPPPDVTPAPAATRSSPPPSAPPANLAAIVLELLPGAAVEPPIPVTNVDVFRALWRAHRARALHENDLPLVATASVLLEAAEHIAPGWLVAARVTFGGQAWAVWVDLERKALLGVARPPEVYLAGL